MSSYDDKKQEKPNLVNALTKCDESTLRSVSKTWDFHTPASRKADFARQMATELLKPETISAMLFCRSQKELDLFEKLLEKRILMPTEKERQLLSPFFSIGFVMEDEDGFVEIPADLEVVCRKLFKDGYRNFNLEAFDLLYCLRAGELTYGIFPFSVLLKLYQFADNEITPERLQRLLNRIPEKFNPCVREGDNFISLDMKYSGEYKTILKKRRKIPFSILNEDEIQVLQEKGYPGKLFSYKTLRLFLKDHEDLSSELHADSLYYRSGKGDHVDDLMIMIYQQFRRGTSVTDIEKKLTRGKKLRGSSAVKKEFRRLLTEVYLSTRNIYLCGGYPEEAYVEENTEEMTDEDADEIIEENVDEIIEENADEIIEENADEIIEENVEEIIEEDVDEVIKSDDRSDERGVILPFPSRWTID